jgi:hypothetical protein
MEPSVLQFWRDYLDRLHRVNRTLKLMCLRFAWEEGEGDRSLAHWRQAHRNFFGRQRFKDRNFDEGMPLVCERFRSCILHRNDFSQQGQEGLKDLRQKNPPLWPCCEICLRLCVFA